MKRTAIAALMLAVAVWSLPLIGCVDEQQQAIEQASAMYEEGDYEGALAGYLALPEESELRESALESVYTCGVGLFNAGNYGACIQYMQELVGRLTTEDELYHKAYDYLYPAQVLNQCLDEDEGESLNWLFVTHSLIASAFDGNQAAVKALDTGLFKHYEAFLDYGGLWRSVDAAANKTLHEGTASGEQEVHTYFLIDNGLISCANCAAETESETKRAIVYETSQENHFEGEVEYIEESRVYLFKGKVIVSPDSHEWIDLSFEISFGDDVMYIDNVKTSSSEYPIAVGAYTRDSVQAAMYLIS